MAFCENCGKEISNQAVACPTCGHPNALLARGAPFVSKRTEGMAVTSLVLGIAGFVVCPLICSILAVIFGNQAKRKIADDPSLDGEGMAKAGVVLGWVGIGTGILLIIAFIVLIANAPPDTTFFPPYPS